MARDQDLLLQPGATAGLNALGFSIERTESLGMLYAKSAEILAGLLLHKAHSLSRCQRLAKAAIVFANPKAKNINRSGKSFSTRTLTRAVGGQFAPAIPTLGEVQ